MLVQESGQITLIIIHSCKYLYFIIANNIFYNSKNYLLLIRAVC